MNIFVLDTNPEIAASYHCDQHLHKMILESAQMLSTVIHEVGYGYSELVYKSAYTHHPCTQNLLNSRAACLWTIELCYALESIRLDQDYQPHASMEIIKIARDVMTDPADPKYLDELTFVFAGPPTIAISSKLSITEKYQKYYRQKHQQWILDKGHGMSYKGRPIPDFMADLIPSTT